MLTDYPQYQNSLAGFVYQAEDAILQQPERMPDYIQYPLGCQRFRERAYKAAAWYM